MDNNKIRVLIADDIQETRRNTRLMLATIDNVEVVAIASNGLQALQLANDHIPDVILMDINMPEMDGLTATSEIRKKHPHIQAIVVSAEKDVKTFQAAIRVGVCDFLVKPYTVGELEIALQHATQLVNLLKTNPRSNKIALEKLLLEKKDLELTLFDLETRISLYDDNLANGKLVDNIEVLVAGLAHDLRSPLNIILSIIDNFKVEDQNINNTIRKIQRRCNYCKWLVDNFLGISLSEKTSIINLSLNFAVDEALHLLENQTSDSVTIQNDVDTDIQVSIDLGLFTIVLVNLLSNSIESIVGRGEISISAKTINNKIAVFIKDNGSPITPVNEKNLFKLGFTTKKSHSGVGLYVSRRLLEQQNGEIYFKQDLSNSTKVFGFLLPNHITQKNETPVIDEINSSINTLKDQIQKLQAELQKFRTISISDNQQLIVSRLFKEITTAFSQNLSNELLAIEAIALDATKKVLPDSGNIHISFQKIIKNSTYCRLLAMNMLELGENKSLKLSKISLIEIVGNILTLLERKMPSYLYNIDWDVDFLIPDIEADEVQIQQVFMNLLKNALDAMPNGGKLRIHFQQHDNFVQTDISDTGIGINTENVKRLFQLGFTTKTKGYGIGLYSIKNIIGRHKGTISVNSELNKGTTFTVYLPITQAPNGE